MSSVFVDPNHAVSQISRMSCSREQGKVVSRMSCSREIWDTAWFGSTKTLDMHISVLRRKLGDDATSPQYIATVRGVGFRFERPQAD